MLEHAQILLIDEITSNYTNRIIRTQGKLRSFDVLSNTLELQHNGSKLQVSTELLADFDYKFNHSYQVLGMYDGDALHAKVFQCVDDLDIRLFELVLSKRREMLKL